MLCYAKSLQSCLTLCDPIDGSLPGSPIHGIFQARVLEWGAIAFSRLEHSVQIYMYVYIYIYIYIFILYSMDGFYGFFHKMLPKNLNELFGPPNICIHECVHICIYIHTLYTYTHIYILYTHTHTHIYIYNFSITSYRKIQMNFLASPIYVLKKIYIYGNPLQYFYLGNPMDRRALRATARGVANSQRQLSN